MKSVFRPIFENVFRGVFRGAESDVVPSNAIRDRANNPILDRFGAFILTRS